jgi:NAD/NADP transhydrogenase alpha subunit
MKIGVIKEIKTHEYRAGLTPASVRELRRPGWAPAQDFPTSYTVRPVL